MNLGFNKKLEIHSTFKGTCIHTKECLAPATTENVKLNLKLWTIQQTDRLPSVREAF